MFLFSDIANVNDKAVSEIIRSIDTPRLAMALIKASDKVREKFYKNMTDRAVTMLKEEIDALHPPALDSLGKKMLLFEDILELDNKTVQEIFKKVDKDILKVALKGTSEEIRQKFYSMMTERGAAMLKEDIEVMAAIPRTSAEEAQKKILEMVRALEKEPFVAQQEILEKIRELEKVGRISLSSEGGKVV
jgi:flagellar motor switch protein FliG